MSIIPLQPLTTKPKTFYIYKHANLPLFRSILDLYIPIHLPSSSTTDLEHAAHSFETSVKQAADSAIPTHSVMPRYLTYPPELYTLLKLKKHYQRRYQRSRVPIYSHLHSLFSQAFNTQLSQIRNKKWSSFLQTLHPQSSKLWKMTRYFKAPTSYPTVIP